jgi:hypothetical protein
MPQRKPKNPLDWSCIQFTESKKKIDEIWEFTGRGGTYTFDGGYVGQKEKVSAKIYYRRRIDENNIKMFLHIIKRH